MRIQSKDLPQADRIESVVLATVAIANRATTDIEIANQVPGIEGDDRQGRYYRRAAEILGFVTNNRNNAQITPKGQQVANNPVLTNPTLLASVINLNLYQKLLPYIELNPQGLTRQEIIDYLQSIAVANIGPSMIPRRISTIIAWIRSLGIIEQVSDRYRIANAIIPSMPVIDMNDIQQPILPTTGALQEYQTVEQRISNANEIITVYKNQARLERATNAHRILVNLVADRMRSGGAIPKANQFIDLAATLEQDFIFEMKSTTAGNVNAQIRKGISQLYEYRYLENKPDANLILVVENPLTHNESWMLDYMETDRNIHLVWDGDGNLYGSQNTRDQLGFLNLLP
jgi:hypothetical protein